MYNPLMIRSVLKLSRDELIKKGGVFDKTPAWDSHTRVSDLLARFIKAFRLTGIRVENLNSTIRFLSTLQITFGYIL